MAEEIARKMHIPRTFLSKIMQKLTRAGILQSFVGMKGGSILAREPSAISLYDVIVAIEGSPAMNTCTVSNDDCTLSRQCPVHPVWLSVKEDVKKLLTQRTFADF